MNGLQLLVDSGRLTAPQAGYLGVALNVLFIVGIFLFVAWGWQYNEEMNKHHCAAVCSALGINNGVTYYPDCTPADNTTGLGLGTQRIGYSDTPTTTPKILSPQLTPNLPKPSAAPGG